MKSLSEKDTKTLFVLGMILTLAGIYFIGFQVFFKQASEVNRKNRALQSQVNELQQKENNREAIVADTKVYQEKIDLVEEKFPDKVTTEGTIEELVNMEKNTGTTRIINVNFNMNQFFYPSQEQGEVVAQEPENVDITNVDSHQGEMPSTEEGAVNSGAITVYRSDAEISFQKLSYDGLKKLFKSAREHDNRMVVEKLSCQLSSESGLLEGDMLIAFYALDGSKKAYKAPEIKGVNLGRPNLFGTFEKHKK